MLDQEAQQAEFGRPQMHRLALAGHPMGREIHRHVAVGQLVGGERRARAAQHGIEPRGELGRRERLGDVIVGAGVQRADLVAFLAARRQHDDGQVAGVGVAAELAADLDAGDQRQHPVEQHQVRAALVDRDQRLLAVHGGGDLEPLALEIVAQHGEQGFLVLDQQDQGFHGVSQGCLALAVAASSGVMTMKLDESPFGRASPMRLPWTTK